MENDIHKFKLKRNILRKHIEELEQEVHDVSQSIDVNNEDDLLRLETLQSNYKTKVEHLKELDEKILDLTEQEEMEDEFSETLKLNDRMTANVTTMDVLMRKMSTISGFGNAANGRPDSQMSVLKKNQVKLPKMEIEKFDGKCVNWGPFWEKFGALIDERDDLTDIEKFNYLNGLLTENARGCIHGLSLTSANYVQAIQILKERYANPQAVISAYMDTLVKLPRLKSMDQLVELRNMYDNIEKCLRNFSVLHIDSASFGALLIPVLTDKFPPELRVIIARRFGDELWDLYKMIEYFKIELQARERCSAVSVNQKAEGKSTTCAIC